MKITSKIYLLLGCFFLYSLSSYGQAVIARPTQAPSTPASNIDESKLVTDQDTVIQPIAQASMMLDNYVMLTDATGYTRDYDDSCEVVMQDLNNFITQNISFYNPSFTTGLKAYDIGAYSLSSYYKFTTGTLDDYILAEFKSKHPTVENYILIYKLYDESTGKYDVRYNINLSGAINCYSYSKLNREVSYYLHYLMLSSQSDIKLAVIGLLKEISNKIKKIPCCLNFGERERGERSNFLNELCPIDNNTGIKITNTYGTSLDNNTYYIKGWKVTSLYIGKHKNTINDYYFAKNGELTTELYLGYDRALNDKPVFINSSKDIIIVDDKYRRVGNIPLLVSDFFDPTKYKVEKYDHPFSASVFAKIQSNLAEFPSTTKVQILDLVKKIPWHLVNTLSDQKHYDIFNEKYSLEEWTKITVILEKLIETSSFSLIPIDEKIEAIKLFLSIKDNPLTHWVLSSSQLVAPSIVTTNAGEKYMRVRYEGSSNNEHLYRIEQTMLPSSDRIFFISHPINSVLINNKDLEFELKLGSSQRKIKLPPGESTGAAFADAGVLTAVGFAVAGASAALVIDAGYLVTATNTKQCLTAAVIDVIIQAALVDITGEKFILSSPLVSCVSSFFPATSNAQLFYGGCGAGVMTTLAEAYINCSKLGSQNCDAANIAFEADIACLVGGVLPILINRGGTAYKQGLANWVVKKFFGELTEESKNVLKQFIIENFNNLPKINLTFFRSIIKSSSQPLPEVLSPIRQIIDGGGSIQQIENIYTLVDVNRRESFRFVSGKWVRIVGRTLSEMRNSVDEWVRLQRQLANSNNQLREFNTATIIYNKFTSRYYYGANRGILISGAEIHPTLAGKLPETSTNAYKIGNCAECDAVNQALHDGANWGDLQMHTVGVQWNTGITFPKPLCSNCEITFVGIEILN